MPSEVISRSLILSHSWGLAHQQINPYVFENKSPNTNAKVKKGQAVRMLTYSVSKHGMRSA